MKDRIAGDDQGLLRADAGACPRSRLLPVTLHCRPAWFQSATWADTSRERGLAGRGGCDPLAPRSLQRRSVWNKLTELE